MHTRRKQLSPYRYCFVTQTQQRLVFISNCVSQCMYVLSSSKNSLPAVRLKRNRESLSMDSMVIYESIMRSFMWVVEIGREHRRWTNTFSPTWGRRNCLFNLVNFEPISPVYKFVICVNFFSNIDAAYILLPACLKVRVKWLSRAWNKRLKYLVSCLLSLPM